jgi:hypothetical protein
MVVAGFVRIDVETRRIHGDDHPLVGEQWLGRVTSLWRFGSSCSSGRWAASGRGFGGRFFGGLIKSMNWNIIVYHGKSVWSRRKTIKTNVDPNFLMLFIMKKLLSLRINKNLCKQMKTRTNVHPTSM